MEDRLSRLAKLIAPACVVSRPAGAHARHDAPHRVTLAQHRRFLFLIHQGTWPCRSWKVPVGPSGGRVATWTMAWVPSVTVCVPRWLLKSVPVKPGSADAVERPGAAGHVDDARMFDCAQQRQERVHHPYRTEDVDRESLHRCVSCQLLTAQARCRSVRVVDQGVQVRPYSVRTQTAAASTLSSSVRLPRAQNAPAPRHDRAVPGYRSPLGRAIIEQGLAKVRPS